MTELEIRFSGDLQRVDLRPGDRFVLKAPQHLSREQVAHIERAWATFVGGDAAAFPLLVIDRGMTLGVLSAPEAARQEFQWPGW